MTSTTVSQEIAEILYNIDPATKVSQEVTEVIASYAPPLRLSQTVIEVIYLPMPLDYGLSFMRAWDSVNNNFVYWLATMPTANPVATNPSFSSIGNLISKTIIYNEV